MKSGPGVTWPMATASISCVIRQPPQALDEVALQERDEDVSGAVQERAGLEEDGADREEVHRRGAAREHRHEDRGGPRRNAEPYDGHDKGSAREEEDLVDARQPEERHRDREEELPATSSSAVRAKPTTAATTIATITGATPYIRASPAGVSP